MQIVTSSAYRFAMLISKHGDVYEGITFWSCACTGDRRECVELLYQNLADLRERLPGVPMLVDEDADGLLSKFGHRHAKT